jgi:hypothetical protein
MAGPEYSQSVRQHLYIIVANRDVVNNPIFIALIFPVVLVIAAQKKCTIVTLEDSHFFIRIVHTDAIPCFV